MSGSREAAAGVGVLASDEEAQVVLALGHTFADVRVLRDALTHRSYVHEQPHLAPAHNETLEFLGDSVVGLAAAQLLWERFPGAREGELTRRRADLVCERTLAKVAQDLHIGGALRLGRGEERSGGRTKARLLASAFEACIAAVLLDAGAESAITIAKQRLAPYLGERAPGSDDYKSRVQEHLQGQGRGTPSYAIVLLEGPEHARTFTVALMQGERELARGTGRSRSEAEHAAARAVLEDLLSESVT